MKRFAFISVMLAFIATASMAQPRMTIETSEYKNTVSLPIESAYWHSEKEITINGIQNLGEGDYLFKLPQKDSLVIKTNDKGDKAMIAKKNHFLGAPFDFRFLYNIKEDERRIVLWYEDNRLYCGYIYDKTLKACQPFRDVKEKEFRRGMNRFGFGFRRMPRFTNN